jgi:hypothetical protein
MDAEKIVIACRPVRLDPNHWLDRELEKLPIYEGAIQVACEVCEELCYVGPRQQQKLNEIEADVLCSRCVLALQASIGEPLDIRSLGNPERFDG